METKKMLEDTVKSVEPLDNTASGQKAMQRSEASEIKMPQINRIASEKESNVSVAPAKQEEYRRARTKLRRYGEVGQWFLTLCWIRIPIVGFFYMFVLALRKKTPPQKRSFAIAYVLYRFLVMLLAFTILFVLYKVGLSFLDEILRYAGGL